MSKKKTHAEFINQVKDRLDEYEVLSDYVDATKKIKFRHKTCGHIFYMKPMAFVYGRGCPVCARKKAGEAKVKSKEEFLASLPAKYKDWEFVGYTRISAPVTAICPTCGRAHTYARAKSFISGLAGCRVCGNVKRKAIDYDKLCAKHDMIFLGFHDDQIIVACGICGDVSLKSNSNLHKNGCRKCAYDDVTKEQTFSLNDANKKLMELGSNFKFIDYAGAVHQATIECKLCGEQFKARAFSFINGSGHCPICSTRSSMAEKEIFQWVAGLCPDAVSADRTVLKGLGKCGQELDIYIPSKKVAIEFNGRYWHSLNKIMETKNLSRAKAKRYHYTKSCECEKQGVRLIHIWDYEWADEKKQKVLKNIILGALGMLPKRYFARNTLVRHYKLGSPRWKELDTFFSDNNVQGNRGGTDVFTLEDNNGEILMAYKFGRPSGGRAKKLYELEMVRGASASGVQVVGGASKLWKHAMEELSPKTVVYYVDYNYFNGVSVEKLGGVLVSSQPGVKNYWVSEDKVKNREPRRHAEVRKAIEDGEVYELWNAGTKTYVFQCL